MCREKAKISHQIAGIYYDQGRAGEARSLYEKSLNLKEQIGDMRGKASTLTMLGQLLADHYDDFDTGTSLFTRVSEDFSTSQVSRCSNGSK